MTIFTLGNGDYAVAKASHAENGRPALTIKRLPKSKTVGTILEPISNVPSTQFDLIIDVKTPEAAIILLTVAQEIAAAHGISV